MTSELENLVARYAQDLRAVSAARSAIVRTQHQPGGPSRTDLDAYAQALNRVHMRLEEIQHAVTLDLQLVDRSFQRVLALRYPDRDAAERAQRSVDADNAQRWIGRH
jgi:hypothetical protein